MIKILIDENLSEHLAKGLDAIQRPMDNGISVVSIVEEFHKGVKDEDWIPNWGLRDGIFITADININRTKHLSTLLSQNSFGAFFLKVPNKLSYWDRVRVLIKHWPEIVKVVNTKNKPYSYLITPNKVEKMP